MRRSVLLAAFALILSTAALAQTPPMSPLIPVNTATTGNQIVSSVAVDGAGNFVVAWDTYDADAGGIAARLFDASGNPLSGEFAVNSSTTGDQYDSWVASDRRGDFVVVWTSYGQLNPTNTEVYARRFVDGNPAGPEFVVNTHTAGDQYVVGQSVAMAPSGEFVVVWTSVGQDGDGYGVFGQRFDSSGNRLGTEFQVNTYTTDNQAYPVVAMNEARQFVVAWHSYGQDGDNYSIVARRYDTAGTPLTAEIPVNTHTTDSQHAPTIGMDGAGNFVVVWNSFTQDGDFDGVFGRRFDSAGAPLTAEFPVNTFTTSQQLFPEMAMDPEGNFVCTWESFTQGGGPAGFGIIARAFDSSATPIGGEIQVNVASSSGQLPAIAMGHHDNFVISWGDSGTNSDVVARLSSPSAGVADVDARAVAGTSSNVNGVLESGETVQVAPHWKNVLATPFAVTGAASDIRGPSGPTYTLDDSAAGYGTIGAGATNDCFGATADCYLVTVSGARPAPHWDAEFDETLSTGTVKTWRLHVGESFPDVLVSDTFYPFVETLFHNQITGGCTGGNYCPTSPVTRAQMAVFLLKSVHGAGYLPPACAGIFGDVPCPSPFADWIEQLAAEGITGGCGSGNYCPSNPVTRAQMAVFLLKAEHGSSYTPPTCAGVFGDVPCPSQFADWIEQLAAEGVTGGCGSGNYCPGNPNTRGQMAVFLTKTFGLTTYPP
jgi:S-layer homology domain